MEPKHKGRRILIVDDDETIAKLIGSLVSRLGCQVVTARSVEDGLRGFKKSHFDAIFMDIFMAGVGGIEGIRMVRAEDLDVPVIAMSGGFGRSKRGDILRAAETIGATTSLSKPFSGKALFDTLDRIWA